MDDYPLASIFTNSSKSKVFVSTSAQAANKDFLTAFQFGENIVLIFDEVHRSRKCK